MLYFNCFILIGYCFPQIWLPNQLQLEYDQKLWLSVTAPVTVIFDDIDNEIYPLWSRVVSSFPEDRLKIVKKENKSRNILVEENSRDNNDENNT